MFSLSLFDSNGWICYDPFGDWLKKLVQRVLTNQNSGHVFNQSRDEPELNQS